MATEELNVCAQAAKAIFEADFLVLATGAGFSADCGLPVYRDIARVPAYTERGLTYPSICKPRWIKEDPELFYGFWGKCFNDYREAIPHRGYELVKKWRDEFFSENSNKAALQKELKSDWERRKQELEKVNPFFIFTSNVDAMHQRAGFHPFEIEEIHGNTETWQCSQPCDESGRSTWSAPKDFSFKVDPQTWLAKEDELTGNEDFRQNNGFISNHPKCMHCGRLARPSILMFSDFSWVTDRKVLWYDWTRAVFTVIADQPTKKLVILEVGAGQNVPSVRFESEELLDKAPLNTTLIRVNMDFIDADYTEHPHRIIGIQGGGMHVLVEIEKELEKLRNLTKSESGNENEIANENEKESGVAKETKDGEVMERAVEDEEEKKEKDGASEVGGLVEKVKELVLL